MPPCPPQQSSNTEALLPSPKSQSNKNGTTPSAPKFVKGDDTPTLDFRNATEWISFLSGMLIFIVAGIPAGLVVFAAMIWEAVDRGFDGGFVDSGKELTGFIFKTAVPWWEKMTHKFNAQFVKRDEDAYMMNCIYGYGIIVPLMFFWCAWDAYHNGINILKVFVYHLLRIGPYFMNFAYVYTLCHKEGHSYAGLYAKGYNDSIIFRNVFNWWIGLFYGVAPATFAYGHSLNHHRYTNGPLDVVTNSDKPRDNFFNWVAYIPRFFVYSINISTIYQFACEKNWKIVWKVTYGTLYFFAWVALWAWAVSPLFTVAFVFFPLFEQCILLAAVNWSWHAFFDPDEPDNEFIQSITILDGSINVLNEDSHVVHHQYPGAHWTDHPKHMEKYWEEYVTRRGSIFRGTHAFEVFGMSVARDYDALANKFADLKGERDGNPMSHEDKVALIKKRLRGCWWGPRADAKAALFTGEDVKKED